MEAVANKTAQGVKPQTNEKASVDEAKKAADFKAKKAEAAKRFAENQKKRKELFTSSMKKLDDLIKTKKITGVPEDLAKYIADVANPPVKAASASRAGFFEKVFGNEAKVGDSITLLDYMKKTLQAKGQLDKAVKQWAEKGTIVEFVEDKGQPFNSKYVIKAIAK